MISLISLTREEQLVLAASSAGFSAQHHDAMLCTLQQGLVWRGVEFLAERNNVRALLYRSFRNVPSELVPEQVRGRFRQAYLSTYQRNQEFARVIATLNGELQRGGVRAVFLRGLVLAERVWGNPSLRRFADIDVLVSRCDAPRAVAIIEGMGGVPRRGTLGNGYYYRNHFHIERLLGDGNGSTVELHWNLDHRYTLFTIDVEGIIERSVLVNLGTTWVLAMDPVDDLLGLCLHAVKHCPAVRLFPDSPLLPRRVLLDGWLIQMLDIAMALHRYGSVDWERLLATARAWGIEPAVAGAFRAVDAMLGVSPPASLARHLSTRVALLPLERALVRAFVDPARTLQPPQRRGFFARAILRKWRFQEDAVFHPVRLLDVVSCLFPPRECLARWYKRQRLEPYSLWWLRHVVVTAARLVVAAFDLVIARAAARLAALHRGRVGVLQVRCPTPRPR